ncbi:effector-binding domain-containing protein [Hydrogenispora ethanolica]|uniref:Effector-binding domain-containing protein n=1 Tax=Hydrogenispora ethanolica TaxID=1082276 RepID=A0A4R1RH66_HYDET|nr:GyrI-like domain-containing protein [Hydrogenispora ethanolica]TCL65259.1 effector-binding domain-containing protein [Hydrogenispora ethanolica]
MMDYHFEVSEAPAQPLLFIRKFTTVGQLPQEIGQACQTVIEYLNRLGEKPLNAALTAYYNLDMEHLDVAMGFPVARPLPGSEAIQAGELPAGKQLSYLYKGPYQGMEPVYNAMFQWLEEQGLVSSGVYYEFYYNSPEEVPESELLTKIVFPLK